MREVTSTTTAAALSASSGNMETYLEGNSNGQQGSSPPAPKKKMCCACPDTKRLRDECVVSHGEDACGKWIDAHKMCLRAEGFKWQFCDPFTLRD